MEWAIPTGLVALLLLACPLMMVGMMAFGWLFMRGRSGGHGMMMCMGHGSHGDGQQHEGAKPLVEELKAERGRLDELIARAEKEGSS